MRSLSLLSVCRQGEFSQEALVNNICGECSPMEVDTLSECAGRILTAFGSQPSLCFEVHIIDPFDGIDDLFSWECISLDFGS